VRKEAFVRRFIVVLLLAAAGGGWFFFQRFRLEGLDGISFKQRTPGAPAPATGDEVASAAGTAVPFARQGNTIRIASFDIQAFGPTKLGKPLVMKTLVDLLRRFDVIALQEIRSPRDDQLPRLVEQLNGTGAASQAGKLDLRHYDFVIGPRQGPDEAEEQFAFVFDAASVSIDRSTVYTVDDPGRRMERDPLVASFQVRGPKDDEAFTFTLVNVRVAADRTSQELTALAEVCRAVRSVSVQDRLEDDIILLGNFNADDRHLGLLGQLPNSVTVLSSIPTNTRGTKMFDNIVFNRLATTEFTGRAGVVDLMHDFSLSMSQALEVSDHLPIWAEFSIYEGGQVGHIAERPSDSELK
jgi:endonuclease/exonuclease/phosphatase family metal-dependent hydrolase